MIIFQQINTKHHPNNNKNQIDYLAEDFEFLLHTLTNFLNYIQNIHINKNAPGK